MPQPLIHTIFNKKTFAMDLEKSIEEHFGGRANLMKDLDQITKALVLTATPDMYDTTMPALVTVTMLKDLFESLVPDAS